MAAYLLREQVKEGQRGPGFAWRCFETDKGHAEWPDISSWTPKASGVTDKIGNHVATRGSNYLLEFTSALEVPADGEWTFAIRSDDGGWIWVDGEPVAANPGMHPATRKEGKLRLTAGSHLLRVGFTQGGGGAVLEAFWSGPGVDEQQIPVDVATTSVTSLVPPDLQLIAPDEDAVGRGRAAARAARCDACHAVDDDAYHALPAPPAAKPWSELSGACSVDGVGDLAASAEMPAELDAATRLHAALVADGCLTCHVRDGMGGLSDEVQATLVEVEDIGEEGLVPPDLSQVGRRLRPEWLERVVRDGHKARDYVRMRMPAPAGPTRWLLVVRSMMPLEAHEPGPEPHEHPNPAATEMTAVDPEAPVEMTDVSLKATTKEIFSPEARFSDDESDCDDDDDDEAPLNASRALAPFLAMEAHLDKRAAPTACCTPT